MRTSHLTLLLTATLGVSAARAQIVSVYGTFSPTHVSNIQTGAVLTSSGYTNQTTSLWTRGFGGGVTFNFLPIGPVALGVDLRGSTRLGTPGLDTAMAGLKLTLKPLVIPFKPYVQASGGYLATRTNNVSTGVPPDSTFTNRYAAYEVFGGVDYKFLPFIDVRLLEIGVGKGYTSGNYNTTIFTANTGFVVHF